MNTLNYVVPVILIAAIFSLLPTYSDQLSRFGRFTRNLAVLCLLIATGIIIKVSLIEHEKLESATIPRLSQATNGLYEVLVTYQNVDGGTLVILHPARITHIDVTERGVSSVRFGSPQLLAIDHPIFGTQPTNSGTFKEFVEIIGEGSGKVIQTFRPFPATQ